MKEVKLKYINSMSDAEIEEALEGDFNQATAWANLVFSALMEKFLFVNSEDTPESKEEARKAVQTILQEAIAYFEESGGGLFKTKVEFTNGEGYIAVTRSGHVSPLLHNKKALPLWTGACKYIIEDIGREATDKKGAPQPSVTIN